VKKSAVIVASFIIVSFILIGLSTCENIKKSFFAIDQGNAEDPYFISGTKEEQDKLKTYFTLLASEAGSLSTEGQGLRTEGLRTEGLRTEGSREQFTLVREIANSYVRMKEYSKLINFLSSRVHQNEDDFYAPYYLFMIAYAYQQMDAYPMAALYFDMIVKNYHDLTVMGKSIHLACLNQLIVLVDNPLQREWYYEELISRFLDQIDPGPSYFMLGQACEGTGDWNNAIKAYAQYLPYAGSNVPGFPNADNYAKQLVDFNNSAKDWTFENLNNLVNAVKNALDNGLSNRLWQYHAKVNFFTRTWEQEDAGVAGVAGHVDFDLSDFMRGNRIRYAETLDLSSTANEAYLRTWGWSQYISTWYLYFRKIYFPLDPEIHGRWEWAGIYYGEKF